MAGLFSEDGLDDIQQGLWDEARLPRHLEQPKGEEGIDALAIAEVDKCLFRIGVVLR
jgi:hypothetical protein